MGTQREVQIGYGGDISSILHLGAARRASLATSPWLYSPAVFLSPSPLLRVKLLTPDDGCLDTWTKQH